MGSVAWHFRDILREVLEEEGIEFGQVVQRPLDGLVDYHLKYLDVLQRSNINT